MKRPVKLTELEIPVVGMQHRVSVSTRRMIAAHVEEHTVECVLVREPENTHDANAVKVVIDTKPYHGFHIGYVPRDIAANLSPYLQRDGVTVPACVITDMDAVDATVLIHVTLKTPVQAKKKKSK